ncbi:hypothetical protein [Tenacibaculum ascidiaceicola]|uniref:hypothetical protein n=1 Tax=Tenacibaculum ascidiaceicola TaxID=1699411 RepID=UPI003CE5B740
MKVLIIGQCQGGNAKGWQEFLDSYSELELVHYICRNYCQSDFDLKSKEKKVFKFYNYFKGFGLLEKVWIKLVSSFFLPIIIRVLDRVYSYNIVHFQGNYEPMFNLSIMKSTRAKSIIHIYGSDFYQKFINGSELARKAFKKAINFSDHVLFNFEVIKNDFLKEINIPEKVSVGCMGVSDLWVNGNLGKEKYKDGITRLLSARGMYAYNNVSFLVESFIELYGNNSSYELYLVNGYGWDVKEKDLILSKIKGYDNIIANVGVWITDEELKGYYDICDYNFCIGTTDQLTVSIAYGYLRRCINILSPLKNYSELDSSNFKSHIFLSDISKKSVYEVLAKLPEIDEKEMSSDYEKAKEKFLFSNRFKNTIKVYNDLKK